MKQYFEYMDHVKVSDTLHQRLLNLETPQKRPAAWKKYSGIAAALVLVCGVGAWGLSHGGWNALADSFHPDAETVPEIADIEESTIPDIAIVEPGDVTGPGMKTIGGYEVQQGEMVAYFMLPGIEYGMADDMAEMALDWGLPAGCTKRDLTQEDFAALFGKEENLSAHLGWEGYELTGWAAWYEDGSLWGMFIYGYTGPMDHFEFAFTAGDTYPPTCIGYGEGVVNELWWGTPVTAYGHDGEYGCDRRVEFLKGGYGFRFDITGTDAAATDLLVSRLVRYLCDYSPFGIGNGFAPDAVTQDGAVLANPWEADPNYSVGEPNWNDGAQDYDSDCPYCADGTVHTHPYNPQEDGVSAETTSPWPPDNG